MPRFVSNQVAFVNNRLVAAGEPFEFDGVPGPHMEPALDEKGREDKAGSGPAPGDPKFLGDLIDHNIAGGGETNGRVDGATGLGQQAPLGIRVDATGQVRGVTENVGTGDPGDGSRRDDKGEDGPGKAPDA